MSDEMQTTGDEGSGKTAPAKSNFDSAAQKAVLTAINRSFAVIEFSPDGTIITANQNFLNTVGYTLEELVGQHHRIFVEPKVAEGQEYARFWEKLRRGAFDAGEYLRVGKGGRQVWIQASYNPVFNAQGEVARVVKFASDITLQKQIGADTQGRMKALSKSQAIIEFDVDGMILYANDNFIKTMGYTSLEDIQGRHHRIFCDPKYVETLEYRKFWDKLRRGEFDAGEYKRYGYDCKEVWIRASYNPIQDTTGRVVRVVKFATDITADKARTSEAEGKVAAISKSQAVIEFTPTGEVITANDNFCKTVGYKLEDIVGKHHKMFCDPAYSNSLEYRAFWEKLKHGEYMAGEFKRINKEGEQIWLQASYNPILDSDGKVAKVVKFASDVTAVKQRQIEAEGKIGAISKSNAVIEFTPDGKVIWANENFCKTVGYTLEEMKGHHHRMFCDHKYVETFEYRQFWDKLNRGEFDAGEYKRLGKSGNEVWINATYNPIRNADGKVFKVVKFAVDITAEKLARAEAQGKLEAINKAQAVVEFKLDGSVITANDNFLNVLGYTLDEIRGKHHRIFCEPKYADSVEYRRFWEKLNRGDYDAGDYKRIGRGGKEVYIQASYNPIKDADGKVFKVVKFATDITEQRNRNAMFEGKVNAISRLRQSLAEYSPDGRLISANENWLRMLNYTWEEVKGRHHREFVDSEFANGTNYRLLWDKLSRGEMETMEGKRMGKNGTEAWVQISYNPVLSADGKVVQVMSIAADITAQHKKVVEFNSQVSQLEETANALAERSNQLTATAATMTTAAKNTSQESVAASRSLSEVASGVQTVAASTEQMVASIREISRSANESAGMSKTTSATTQETNDVVKELGTSSLEIGEVTKVISSIAQQTNLLALNATIEAARAGDAGKGFAVVANEVKELARQTAKATQDITQKIGAIQKNSSRAVEAIGGIAQAVDKLNSISGTIAAAVEEQTATTNEVSRVINTASENVKQISTSVNLVSTTADENSDAATKTLEASHGLSQLAEKLKDIVRKVKSA